MQVCWFNDLKNFYVKIENNYIKMIILHAMVYDQQYVQKPV